MLPFVLSIVGGLIVVILLAIFINKIPRKFHIIMVVLLLGASAFFGYKLYKSIEEPVKFKAVKEERYRQVIAQLVKLREAQNAHKTITGTYSNDIDKLARFIDTAQFARLSKRDTSVVDRERNIKFRLDPETGGYYKEITIVDTLGFTPVKDSLFKEVDIKSLLTYKFKDAKGKIDLATDVVIDKENRIPVFRARADKRDILHDQPEKLVVKELEVTEIEAVKGEFIEVGSLDEITTSGNWPRQFAPDDKK
ncbi:MAG: hypothetical protein WBA16_06440 [Nonlabens sp.]